MTELFDPALRAARRDRAARMGFESFLYDRALDDCIERVGLVQRHFERALLIGCPTVEARARLDVAAAQVETADPGAIFAAATGGKVIQEDQWSVPPGTYDLIVAIGTLDTVNDLPAALRSMRAALRPDALLIGAISGGDTLPMLRSAMRAADQVAGSATPHVHPRIEAAMLAPLLTSAGFVMPVVDVDRIAVRYSSLSRLVGDLRAMGATNVLRERSRAGLNKDAYAAAERQFTASATDGRTTEIFEILHFAAWTPA